MGEFNLEEGWIFEVEAFDVKTYYKLTPDSPAPLWVKVESVYQNTSLFDTIAVINETDLYNTWLPFCTKSRKLKQITNTEQLIYFNNAVPLSPRDAVLQAYSVDAMEERATVIMGKSVESFPGIEMPPIDGWFGADRMVFHAMKFLVEPVTDTTVRIVWIANLDLKSPVPQAFLNFILRKVACFFLVFLGRTVRSITEEGEKSVYRQRMKKRPEFYEWLRIRMEDSKEFLMKKYMEGNLPPAWQSLVTQAAADPKLRAGIEQSMAAQMADAHITREEAEARYLQQHQQQQQGGVAGATASASTGSSPTQPKQAQPETVANTAVGLLPWVLLVATNLLS
eukprot:TRINITY_DN4593_c0_g2_i1.p1 TRINITY_DN4593_c0_g2~~TRINITY_DN4593_c0_g2_i1.p1  ORF type:complete len:338 (+),score=95.83 TRINITY_DN4593_c0_g2_i1:982-1995(+)